MKLKRIRFGKKGAACVFITMILAAMFTAVTVVGNAAFDKLKEADADAALRIGARSVLGEYDIRLKKDYGIFAYKGTANEVESKVQNYAESNLFGSFSPLSANSVETDVENIKYCLLEPENLRQQIIAAGKFCLNPKDSGRKREKPADALNALVSQADIMTLPSQGKNLRMLDVGKLAGKLSSGNFSIGGFIKSTGDNLIENNFIMSTFGNRFREVTGRGGVFNYEVEYILGGKTSENANLQKVKAYISAFREVLNTAHIMADPEKMSKAAAYAASIPTPGDPIETAVIVALWASAETENDVKRLLEGKNVALIKTKSQWALSLEAAVANLFVSWYKSPSDEEGQDYEDYLAMLLLVEDEETKLLRIMDLMQMNLRKDYNNNFLIKCFFTGFDLKANVDGKEFTYAQGY